MMILHELKNQFKLYFIIFITIFVTFLVLLFSYKLVILNESGISNFLNKFNDNFLRMIELDKTTLFTPSGYYYNIYSVILLILTFFALLTGIIIILNDRINNLKEFLFTKPIPRKKIIISRFIIHVIFFGLIILLFHLTSINFFLHQKEEIDHFILFKINISLFVITITFLSIGMMIGSLTKAKHTILVALAFELFFFIIKLIQNRFDLQLLRFINPLDYFEIVDLNVEVYPYRFLLMAGAILVFTSSFAFSVYENIDLNKYENQN